MAPSRMPPTPHAFTRSPVGRTNCSINRNQIGTTATMSAARPVGTYSSAQARIAFDTPSRRKPRNASWANCRRVTAGTPRPVSRQNTSSSDPEIVNLTPASRIGGIRSTATRIPR